MASSASRACRPVAWMSGAGAGAEHHQAHDGVAGDGLAVAAHLDLGVEALGGPTKRAEARACRPLRLTIVNRCASARPNLAAVSMSRI
jgi:hypothetical protein